MRKTEFLEYWEEIESNQEVIPEPLALFGNLLDTFVHPDVRI